MSETQQALRDVVQTLRDAGWEQEAEKLYHGPERKTAPDRMKSFYSWLAWGATTTAGAALLSLLMHLASNYVGKGSGAPALFEERLNSVEITLQEHRSALAEVNRRAQESEQALRRARAELEELKQDVASLPDIQTRLTTAAEDLRNARARLDRSSKDLKDLEERYAALLTKTRHQEARVRIVEADQAKLSKKLEAQEKEITSIKGDVRRLLQKEDLDGGRWPESPETVVGKIIKVGSHELLVAGTVREFLFRITGDTRVTCDGKQCKLESLKPGMMVRVTTRGRDTKTAVRVEASQKRTDFDK